jgi:hypothetical protein
MYFLLTSYFSQLNQEFQPDLVMLSYHRHSPLVKNMTQDYSDDDDNEMDKLSVDQMIFYYSREFNYLLKSSQCVVLLYVSYISIDTHHS